jgi:hypothetical protein
VFQKRHQKRKWKKKLLIKIFLKCNKINIIDNASTYPPLLAWYDEIKNDIKFCNGYLQYVEEEIDKDYGDIEEQLKEADMNK